MRHSRKTRLKIGFISLGCPKNLVDTEVMMGLVRARGHQLEADPKQCDVIVVNTCSFIGPAQQESVDSILEMARYKSEGRLRRLIVAGCLVERFEEEIRQQIPEVDQILGTNDIERILDACEGRPFARSKHPYLYDDRTPRVLTTPKHYAYIKIAEGCDHSCSFCIIPQLRGRFRSRKPASVVAEATKLFQAGVREIILVAQDTTAYAEDLGMRDGLAQLLEKLATLDVADPRWIRFLYAYPNKISSRLLETLAQHHRLVKYLDLPLQHASRQVLKGMRRGGSGEQFLKLVERIRRAVPGIAIRTSLIVGFPGETEQDFEELCDFLRAAQFDHVGVFGYSDEETAPSFRLDGKVSRREIYNRKRHLMAIQRRISRARNRSRVGQESTVLVEGPSQDSKLIWQARLPSQAPEIDGVCYITDAIGAPPRAGEIRKARICKAHDYDLEVVLLDTGGEQSPGQVFQLHEVPHLR